MPAGADALGVPQDAHIPELVFRPARPPSRASWIATLGVGPFIWVVALVVAAWLIQQTDAIELALLVSAGSLAVALLVLVVLRAKRMQEERRYGAGD